MVLPRDQAAKAIQEILRLRRAEDCADAGMRVPLRSARAFLEELLGPTVSRAEAARLLGLSQTGLDRWIANGEIPAVHTPEGRREVPLAELTDLLEQVERARATGAARPLARVIRERRRSAETIDLDRLLPRGPRSHRTAELQALAYHRLVAERLDDLIVEEAKRRLDRWRGQGRIDARWAARWERILELPLDQIAEAIGADTPRARDLRQTSPFVGVLNEQERRHLLRSVDARG
jgi:excisionase family DNA binding protein